MFLTINYSANQELNVVMFHRSYHFVQELKANSPASENSAKGIGIQLTAHQVGDNSIRLPFNS